MLRSEYAANVALQSQPVVASWLKPAPVRTVPTRHRIGLFARLLSIIL